MVLNFNEQKELAELKHKQELELLEKRTIFEERQHQLKMQRLELLKQIADKDILKKVTELLEA